MFILFAYGNISHEVTFMTVTTLVGKGYFWRSVHTSYREENVELTCRANTSETSLGIYETLRHTEFLFLFHGWRFPGFVYAKFLNIERVVYQHCHNTAFLVFFFLYIVYREGEKSSVIKSPIPRLLATFSPICYNITNFLCQEGCPWLHAGAVTRFCGSF